MPSGSFTNSIKAWMDILSTNSRDKMVLFSIMHGDVNGKLTTAYTRDSKHTSQLTDVDTSDTQTRDKHRQQRTQTEIKYCTNDDTIDILHQRLHIRWTVEIRAYIKLRNAATLERHQFNRDIRLTTFDSLMTVHCPLAIYLHNVKKSAGCSYKS